MEGVVSSETAFVGAFVSTDVALRCSFLKGSTVRYRAHRLQRLRRARCGESALNAAQRPRCAY